MLVDLHQLYGEFVRIGPNHISISTPEPSKRSMATKVVTSKAPSMKICRSSRGLGCPYEIETAFNLPIDVLFSTRDHVFHAKRRISINPAFSQRALKEFQVDMSGDCLDLKKVLLAVNRSGDVAQLDFALWGVYEISYSRPASFPLFANSSTRSKSSLS